MGGTLVLGLVALVAFATGYLLGQLTAYRKIVELARRRTSEKKDGVEEERVTEGSR